MRYPRTPRPDHTVLGPLRYVRSIPFPWNFAAKMSFLRASPTKKWKKNIAATEGASEKMAISTDYVPKITKICIIEFVIYILCTKIWSHCFKISQFLRIFILKFLSRSRMHYDSLALFPGVIRAWFCFAKMPWYLLLWQYIVLWHVCIRLQDVQEEEIPLGFWKTNQTHEKSGDTHPTPPHEAGFCLRAFWRFYIV